MANNYKIDKEKIKNVTIVFDNVIFFFTFEIP